MRKLLKKNWDEFTCDIVGIAGFILFFIGIDYNWLLIPGIVLMGLCAVKFDGHGSQS